MEIGDRIRIKEGTTRYMKDQNAWMKEMGDNIDGFGGEVIAEYRDCIGVNIGFDLIVSIPNQYVERV